MYVTHLECSLTGDRYPAGEPHNLSAAGKPLLVRYDHAPARIVQHIRSMLAPHGNSAYLSAT